MSHLDPAVLAVLAGVGVLAAVGLFTAFNSGRRHARHGLEGVRQVTRTSGAVLRTLLTATLIAGAQLLVITLWSDNLPAVLAALGLPALIAGHTIAKTLAVTEVVSTTRHGRGGGRR